MGIALEKKIWHVAAYIRLSRDDGSDESISVANQRQILLEFLEHSFQGEHILEGIYVDDGESGTDYDRPAFQRMLRHVEEGRINCIICKNLSRAFRNYSDQGYFLESFFPRFHIRFITLGEPVMDTFLHPDAVNGMEVPINGLMNDRFAYKTSCDIRRTLDTKRRKGEFIGAFAPYGYVRDLKDKKRLIIDPKAAWVVQHIFLWYVYGDGDATTSGGGRDRKGEKGTLSKEGIARKLNAMGIPNPTAYKRSNGLKYYNPHSSKNDGLWQGTGISAILSNEIYTGTMVQGKQRVISYKVHKKISVPKEEWYRVENTHEAIIDPRVFAMAQELQEKDIRRPPMGRQNYLFSGVLRCADCQKAMTRKPSKNLVYYNCSTYKRKSKSSCTIHSIRLDILESVVLTVIRKQIETGSRIDEVIEKIRQAPTAEYRTGSLEAFLEVCTRKLERTKAAQAQLYLDWKNGDLNHEEYIELKETFQKQRKQLKKEIFHITEEMEELEKALHSHCSCVQSFLRNKNIEVLSQGLLLQLVKDIFVHEGGGITIVFKFKDPYKREAMHQNIFDAWNTMKVPLFRSTKN